MSTTAVVRVLDSVIAGIQAIDYECETLLNGIEHGLANVKLEFAKQALDETGKRLTEEKLIAWLLRSKLNSLGNSTNWEVAYPGERRKKCDLVIDVDERSRLWLELKLAWKAWFNCVGEPTCFNPWYSSYLAGGNRSHSFRDDLYKLSRPDWPPNNCRAVCLLGADWIRKPMDDDVRAVVEQFEQSGYSWRLATERHWADRRADEFRLNVWCWLLQPPATSFISS